MLHLPRRALYFAPVHTIKWTVNLIRLDCPRSPHFRDYREIGRDPKDFDLRGFKKNRLTSFTKCVECPAHSTESVVQTILDEGLEENEADCRASRTEFLVLEFVARTRKDFSLSILRRPAASIRRALSVSGIPPGHFQREVGFLHPRQTRSPPWTSW